MTAAWMMYLLLVGVLMTGAARVLAGAMRTFGRPTRWVWAAALASVVALALVAPRQEVDQTQLAPAEATRAAVALSSLSQRVPRALAIAFVAAWAIASAALLALFVAVNVRIARARRRWP